MPKNINPADFIVPLEMNGLSGRMLHMPAPSGKAAEILFVYGQHSSLERWWGLAQYANRYGAVTMPDLPGFGGMESFYKIAKKPTIDNLADYLAAFMKMRYKRRKKVVIVGMSFGFVVVTRMLQRYPELAKHIDTLISVVGFAHSDEFTLSRKRYWFYRLVASVCSYRLPALCFRYACLNARILRLAYQHTRNAKAKFNGAAGRVESDTSVAAEIWLWQHNDVRTYACSLAQSLSFDNCQLRVQLPLWHVSGDTDQYFDNHRIEQHLQVIFPEVHVVKSKLGTHAPSVVADAVVAKTLIPIRLQRLLAKL